MGSADPGYAKGVEMHKCWAPCGNGVGLWLAAKTELCADWRLWVCVNEWYLWFRNLICD